MLESGRRWDDLKTKLAEAEAENSHLRNETQRERGRRRIAASPNWRAAKTGWLSPTIPGEYAMDERMTRNGEAFVMADLFTRAENLAAHDEEAVDGVGEGQPVRRRTGLVPAAS